MSLVEHMIAGVILAGGKSLRMGIDKNKLIYQNNTLLNHMNNLLKNLGIKNIYISSSTGIEDEIKGKGPLCGIHATLKELSDKYNFLIYVPVDMPNLQVDLMQKLLNAPQRKNIVRFGDYILPFRLKVNTMFIDIIEQIFKEGKNYSIRNFQKIINIHTLHINQTNIKYFTNINTPYEWKKYIG